uniref:DNA polymerase n=1 Tax=Trichuris muris TaxID=70415 RepID=A0A5S6Q974_TRIMR
MSEDERARRRGKQTDSRKAALQKLMEAKKRGKKNRYNPDEYESDYQLMSEAEYKEWRDAEKYDDFIVDGTYADSDDSRESLPRNEEENTIDKRLNKSRSGIPKRRPASNPLAEAFRKAKPKTEDYNVENDEVYKQLVKEINEMYDEREKKSDTVPGNSIAKRNASSTYGTFPPNRDFSSVECNQVPKSVAQPSKRVMSCSPNAVSPQKPPSAKASRLDESRNSNSQCRGNDGSTATPISKELHLSDVGFGDVTLDMLGSDFEDSLSGIQKIDHKPAVEPTAKGPTDFRAVNLQRESNSMAYTAPCAASVGCPAVPKSHSIAPKAPLLEKDKPESPLVLPEIADQVQDEIVASDTVRLEDFATMIDDQMTVEVHYLDAVEDPLKHPGYVFIFGKVFNRKSETWTNCCVTVTDILRRIWLLPRDINGVPCQLQQVYDELSGIMERMHVPEFKVKKVTKKFWLRGGSLPNEADYLEVRYPFSFPPLASTLSGKTFSAVVGESGSALELLILERGLKGPRPIRICNAEITRSRRTWCTLELTAKPSDLVPSAPSITPPLSMLIVNFITMQNAKTGQNELVLACLMTNDSIEIDKDKRNAHGWQHFCIVTKSTHCLLPPDFKSHLLKQNLTTVIVVPNERALLNLVLAKLQKLNPDVILGHDLIDFGLFNFVQRISHYSVPNWSRLSRLRRSVLPKLVHTKGALRDLVAGRLLCDVKTMAMEFIRAKGYSLQDLALEVLNENCEAIEPESVKPRFKHSETLLHLIKKCLADAFTAWRICEKLHFLQLSMEITRVVGGIMSKTMMGGRAERIEYLLLHAFNSLGYVYPEKQSKKGRMKTEAGDVDDALVERKKASYTGGLVLEPKKGFYDKFVLLLDFNSLYPSIIQEYNICFTTVETRPKTTEAVGSDWIPALPESSKSTGVLPCEIKRLVQSRQQVKQMMKSNCSAELWQQYNIRQQALKITANSVYGCLGFGGSRFYAKPLAALVTSKGREILIETKDVVEKLGLEVVYGDTDSIMVKSNYNNIDEALSLGKKVKAEVNKRYRLLELEIDGVYKKLLLLKKKKYAALAIERGADGRYTVKKELKGLDIVRRDWSGVAVEAGKRVVDEILGDKQVDDMLDNIMSYLSQLAASVRENSLPLDIYVIHKQLTKDPTEYLDKTGQPHVAVALRMNAMGHHFQHGDVVDYVICSDGTSNPATKRAYHLKEVQSQSLPIDVNYYLSQQIHPVVARLCEPIEGADVARLAECLGLDPSSYHRRAPPGAEANVQDVVYSSSLVDFSGCTPFSYNCPGAECNRTVEISSVFRGEGAKLKVTLLRCPNENCDFSPLSKVKFLKDVLRMQIRQAIKRYYEGWLICDDISCGYRTRRLPNCLNPAGQPYCLKCRLGYLSREYSERSLYNQLYYYQRLFDFHGASMQLSIENRRAALALPRHQQNAYNELKSVADHFLKMNAYGVINLAELFKCLLMKQ